jgi:8-amino-7-oxononanoate synthase
MSDFFQEQLQALRAQSLHRKLREIGTAQGARIDVVGQRLVNFSSHDYLALANDPLLREAATAAIAEYGVGAGASRLNSGTQSPHVRLELALAKWLRAEAALCFSSGYAAAVGVIPALVGKQDVVIIDKLCHSSLKDGAKLSGATIRVFPHNHLGQLEFLLDWALHEHSGARVLVVTESVSWIDGDRADVRGLIGLKRRYGAMLLLDESHAVGVVGENGRGLAAEENLECHVDVQIGTLSKALGVSGGYVCGSRNLIEWLVNRARSFIFSSAQAPALAAATLAAVEFLDSDAGEHRRVLLWQRIGLLRRAFTRITPMDPPITESGSAIHPIAIGDETAAVELTRALQTQGMLVPVIRSPWVARGAARLQITVTAGHEEPEIRALARALNQLRPGLTAAA